MLTIFIYLYKFYLARYSDKCALMRYMMSQTVNMIDTLRLSAVKKYFNY